MNLHETEARCSIDRVDGAGLEDSSSQNFVDYADRARRYVIVIGTHGRGGLHRLLVGGDVEDLVHSSPACVLTIRTAEHEPLPTISERSISADPSRSEALG